MWRKLNIWFLSPAFGMISRQRGGIHPEIPRTKGYRVEFKSMVDNILHVLVDTPGLRNQACGC